MNPCLSFAGSPCRQAPFGENQGNLRLDVLAFGLGLCRTGIDSQPHRFSNLPKPPATLAPMKSFPILVLHPEGSSSAQFFDSTSTIFSSVGPLEAYKKPFRPIPRNLSSLPALRRFTRTVVKSNHALHKGIQKDLVLIGQRPNCYIPHPSRNMEKDLEQRATKASVPQNGASHLLVLLPGCSASLPSAPKP